MTNDSAWRELYRVALLELRPEELQQRIAAAEKAIQQRIVDLRRCDSSSGQEMQELKMLCGGCAFWQARNAKARVQPFPACVQGR